MDVFPFACFSLCCFHQKFVSLYRSFTSVIKIMANIMHLYYIIFLSGFNGIVFFIFFQDTLLLTFRNKINSIYLYYILEFCTKSLIKYNSWMMILYGSFLYKIISIANRFWSLLFLSIQIPLFLGLI